MEFELKIVYECEICNKKLTKTTFKQISLYLKPIKNPDLHYHFELCKDCFKAIQDKINEIKRSYN